MVDVIDANGRQIARRFTDDGGAFSFSLPRREAYRIRASQMGFRETTTPVLWRDGFEQIHVDVRLAVDAIPLAPLEVVARARPGPSPVLSDFRARRASDIGNFISREEIVARGPSLVTDLLAVTPGVQLVSEGRGTRRLVYMNRGTRRCPARIYVDGLLVNRRDLITGEDYGFTLDDAVSPEDVEGIEIYTGLSTVPAEFLSAEASCGVVAIWTRRGGNS